MLTITPETLAAIESRCEQTFIAELLSFLRENVESLASATLAQVEAQVRLQVEAARGWSIMSEKNVAIFVLTAAQLGIDFVDRFPRAREIVSSQLSSEDKATELEVFTRTLFETLALP